MKQGVKGAWRVSGAQTMAGLAAHIKDIGLYLRKVGLQCSILSYGREGNR